jgi:hypothetical protein
MAQRFAQEIFSFLAAIFADIEGCCASREPGKYF